MIATRIEPLDEGAGRGRERLVDDLRAVINGRQLDIRRQRRLRDGELGLHRLNRFGGVLALPRTTRCGAVAVAVARDCAEADGRRPP